MRLLQSLSRGLEALDYLRANAEPVRLTEVAATLGVDKSNAAHVLKTLVAAGYAGQDDRRRYVATAKATRGQFRQHSLEAIVAVKEAWRPRWTARLRDRRMRAPGGVGRRARLVHRQGRLRRCR